MSMNVMVKTIQSNFSLDMTTDLNTMVSSESQSRFLYFYYVECIGFFSWIESICPM